ncbi:MAG: C_GCAxxG_C_C family protein [Chloroflexota bacterium]|nr:MAG: C_GCAxxG_C_C family protein [Chloroflexota bacterium]
MATEKVTRRTLLTSGAKLVVVGAGMGASGLGLLSGCTGQAAAPAASPTAAGRATQPQQAIPEWPWPYVSLDPQVVAQKGYESYYQAGCMYGAFNAIISALSEKVGYPYTVIPTMMVKYGEGGVVGWASLCGAINGASLAINLVTKDYAPIVNELVGWYTVTAFPSFKPSSPKVEIKATSVSGSPLCHVSVTEWCNAAGAKSESPERAERCGRLTGEVAARAVELLNKQTSGGFQPAFKLSASVGECGACHLKGGTIENARGKMDCIPCHEPHIKQ